MTRAAARANTNGYPTFSMDPNHNAPTWRDVRDRGIGVNWGEGYPWKTRDMDLGKMMMMCDLPQDCSLMACYLMRHGYEAGDVATIATYKGPFRSEVHIGGIRYAVHESQIHTMELEE